MSEPTKTTEFTGWRPIASAPHVEGQPILLWDGDVSVGQWDGHRSWYAVSGGSYVWEGDDDRGGIARIDDPSHWMPLPEPPL
jgi:hypothetical protein